MNLLSVLMAVCGGIVVYNLIQLLAVRGELNKVKRRVNVLAQRDDLEAVRGKVLEEKKKKKERRDGIHMVSEKMESELAAAGIKISGEEFLQIWVVAIFGPALILAMFRVSVITIMAVMIMGLALPPMMISSARKKKAALFNKQLGEGLMVMSNSLRAGYSFQTAMESIAKDMQPPLSEEFQMTLREMEMGLPLETALKHMVERTKNDDVKILVSAILISSQVGANLADVIDSIAGTIRERIELREQIGVLTAQGRLSGTIVGLLPIVVVLFLMITNPSYIMGFVETPIGIAMMIAGIVMEIMGFVVINRLVDIKY